MLGSLSSHPALAQAKVLATPDTLTITGTRGAADLETRTLTVRSTEPVTDLRVYTFDLYNSDRDRVFPQSLITAPSTIDQVEVDALEEFSVEFSFQDAPSGEFQGDLLLSYQGNEVTVPIMVRVKDTWYGPFVLLVFGVMLGTTVSSYSRWGKTTDEVTVSIESLRTQIASEQKLPPSFASRISTHLADAQLARDAKQLEVARQSITKARTVWNKWFRQRSQWLAALDIGKILSEKLATLPLEEAQALYLQAIQRKLKDILDDVVDLADAGQLGQYINRFSQQSALYLRVHRKRISFQNNLDDLSPSSLTSTDQQALQGLKDSAINLAARLSSLQPTEQSEDPQLQGIEQELNQATNTLNALKTRVEDSPPIDGLGEFTPGKGKSVDSKAAESDGEADLPEVLVTEAPSFAADENPVLQGITALIPNPNQRLQLFSVAGYLTTIVFLAGTGFNQLYLENPTFGSSGLRDYFALLAWGFGAEATRSAVTNALRRTDDDRT